MVLPFFFQLVGLRTTFLFFTSPIPTTFRVSAFLFVFRVCMSLFKLIYSLTSSLWASWSDVGSSDTLV